MNVRLISCTQNALELLIYTKSTRLDSRDTFKNIIRWPYDKKIDHLDYMRKTIKSSWEFIDYVFEISGVTRSFTHQLVRTRTGSYAQESMRTVNVSDRSYNVPDLKDKESIEIFKKACNYSLLSYSRLIDEFDSPVQDARGVLPENINTSIIAKYNLRTLHEMAELRLCKRTQGEYQNVFKKMKSLVVDVHPWAEDFIKVYCVNHSNCFFPNYKECPIQVYTISESERARKAKEIEEAWEDMDHEAVPKIIEPGKTM